MGRIDTYPSGSQIVPVTGSTLGYAEVTAVQAGISTETALTGLSVNVSVPAGRRIRVTGQVQITSATTSATALLRIKEGSTTLQTSQENYNTIGGNGKYLDASVVLSPSAGSHTYNLTLQGTGGTIDLNVGAGVPAFILVEDVTGSQYSLVPPYVPVGQLAYGQRTSNQTGIGTTPVLIGGLSVNVAVPAGRQIKITGFLPTFTKTSGAPTWVRAYIRRNGVDVQRTIESANNDTFTALTVEHVESPAAGSHTYEIYVDTDTGTVALDLGSIGTGANAFILVEDVTQSPLAGQGAPASTLGYASIIATTGTLGPAESDIPGLSVNVTVPAGRRIKVTGFVHARSSVATDTVYVRIVEDANSRNFAYINEQGSTPGTGTVTDIWTPTAGSHTIKLRVARQAGSGNVTVYAAPLEASYILVEDVTGAVWPAGATVTAGMVAPDPWVDWVPTVTQSSSVTINIVRAKYFKVGRTVHIMASLQVTGTGVGANPVVISGLPFPAAVASFQQIGAGKIFDASVGDDITGLLRFNNTSTALTMLSTRANGTLGQVTFTAALALSDNIDIHGTYEAAS